VFTIQAPSKSLYENTPDFSKGLFMLMRVVSTGSCNGGQIRRGFNQIVKTSRLLNACCILEASAVIAPDFMIDLAFQRFT
jgi:hypothetical protein